MTARAEQLEALAAQCETLAQHHFAIAGVSAEASTADLYNIDTGLAYLQRAAALRAQATGEQR